MNNEGPLVSIVVPVYNGRATLANCVYACLNQTYTRTEVIVVDDGSTDGSPQIAAELGVRVHTQTNRGPAAARNAGARLAQGEWIAFTDADCIPQADWIERLVNELDEGVVAVGGAYGIANPESVLARLVHWEIEERHADMPREVDFLGSFNVLYRKDAFDAVGGFDESFRRASAEDNDLAYRLTDHGGKLVFTAAAKVDHHHPERLWPYLRTQAAHGYWRMRLYAKHPARSKGDRYAGVLDFSAPPVALASVSSAAVVPLAPLMPEASVGIYGTAGLFGLLFLLLHAPMAIRIAQRQHTPTGVLFIPLGMVRSFARALGMALGVTRFFVLRKTF